MISNDVHILTSAELAQIKSDAFQEGLRFEARDDKPLRKALLQTLTGLDDMVPSRGEAPGRFGTAYLRFMIERAKGHVHTWPVDKTSRWIGFIQAALYARGALDIDTERDRTRPFFHQAYTEMGMPWPASVDGPRGPVGPMCHGAVGDPSPPDPHWPNCSCRSQCPRC